MSKNLLRLIRYGLCGKYVFHGSPKLIDGLLLPNKTSRGSDGVVMYEGTSLHATPLLYVALNYLTIATQTCASGVCLFHATNTIDILCMDSKQTTSAALQMLFARGGYVYVLASERFSTTKGLGMLEVISRKAVQPVHRVRLSKNDAITLLRMLGTRIQMLPQDAGKV